MPWCQPCARFYNPNTLDERGDCPAGHHVADPPDPAAVEEVERPRVPWHFWLLIAALSGYLGWRLLQGIGWLIDKL